MIFLKKTLLTIPITLALRVNVPLVEDVPTPVKDGVITSQFGRRVHPIFKVMRFHSGIDIAGVKDSKALSVGSGIVVYAGKYRGYGNLVVISHSNGISTHYAHLGEIDCSVGEVVSSGSVLGIIGSTGESTAPHLHFEVRKNGRAMDPKRVIPSLKSLKMEQKK
jgi:murein DD-endopeptidase MepM/ murein hydrolase activator NlpD